MKKELFNGKRLKVARIYRGKTIDQVSKETNINKKDILAFEENKYKPTVENALKLSNVLHFPREYFYKTENIKINVDAVHFNPQSTTQRNEIADNTLREVFSDPSIFNDWAMGVKEAVVSQL